MRLQDVCTVFSDGDWIESKDQSDKGIRLVQTGNIGEGLYLEKEERAKYVSEETFESLKCTEIYPGDILISRLPEPVGRACIIPPKKERMITAVDCTICRVDESIVSKEYLCYFMRSNAYYTKLLGSVTGTTRKRISRKNLGNIELEIPPKEEQTDVVSQLERLINVINSRNKELQLLDDLIKARFVEMFGDPIDNSKGYAVHQLSEYITSLTSGSRGWAQYCVDDGDEWFIAIKNVKGCHIFTDNMQSVNAPDNAEAKRTKVQEGDLLISITADLGRTGVVTKEIAEHGAYINQHLSCIRINRDVLNPLFVAHYMESPAGKEQFAVKNQSAVKAGLNFNSINSLKLIVPPLVEQNKFIDFIEQVDKSKVAVQKALDETKLLFDSLMQQYFG